MEIKKLCRTVILCYVAIASAHGYAADGAESLIHGRTQQVEGGAQKVFPLQDTSALMTKRLSSELYPFNSMRIKLIQRLQESPKTVLIQGKQIALHSPDRVAAFYQQEQFPTVWTQEHHFTPLLAVLQRLVGNSAQDALNPLRYHADVIKSLHEKTDYRGIIDYELLLSDAYLTLLGDLTNGLVDPHLTQPEWNAAPTDNQQLAALFAQGVLQKDIVRPIQVISQNPRYQALKSTYNSLRRRLAAQPDDARLNQQLNTVAINMERLRWLPQDLGDAYILVNIPRFWVQVYHNATPVYESRVVVGRPDRPTPTFTEPLRYIVMSPTWTVPPTILKEDKIPQLLNNPTVYDGRFEVVTPSGKVVAPSTVDWSKSKGYVLRQKSGKNNALGRIKFLFPNDHAIYLHDTPAKHLFSKDSRAYSSGCVRVQNPLVLANIILQDTEWTKDKIKAVSEGDREKWVNTPRIPVYLVYWTAWADDEGQTRFSRDIYHYDEPLVAQYIQALNQKHE